MVQDEYHFLLSRGRPEGTLWLHRRTRWRICWKTAFGKSGGTIYDSVIAKCKSCGEAQAFQFPKERFISEARSAMALRDYLQATYGIDYAGAVRSDLQSRAVKH